MTWYARPRTWFGIVPDYIKYWCTRNEWRKIKLIEETKEFGWLFDVPYPDGETLTCLEFECEHLNGGNWDIKEIPNVDHEQAILPAWKWT